MINFWLFLAIITWTPTTSCPSRPTVLVIDTERYDHGYGVMKELESPHYDLIYFDWASGSIIPILQWAVMCRIEQHSPILGLNLSWMTHGHSQTTRREGVLMTNLAKTGVLVIAASGNSSRNIDDTRVHPADNPYIIPVCAYDLASSNWSSRCLWDSGITDDDRRGTSFAAPRILKKLVEHRLRVTPPVTRAP